MTPAGERLAGPDAMPRYRAKCSCGVDEDVYTSLDECPKMDNHVIGEDYIFSCEFVK